MREIDLQKVQINHMQSKVQLKFLTKKYCNQAFPYIENIELDLSPNQKKSPLSQFFTSKFREEKQNPNATGENKENKILLNWGENKS